MASRFAILLIVSWSLFGCTEPNGETGNSQEDTPLTSAGDSTGGTNAGGGASLTQTLSSEDEMEEGLTNQDEELVIDPEAAAEVGPETAGLLSDTAINSDPEAGIAEVTEIDPNDPRSLGLESGVLPEDDEGEGGTGTDITGPDDQLMGSIAIQPQPLADSFDAARAAADGGNPKEAQEHLSSAIQLLSKESSATTIKQSVTELKSLASKLGAGEEVNEIEIASTFAKTHNRVSAHYAVQAGKQSGQEAAQALLASVLHSGSTFTWMNADMSENTDRAFSAVEAAVGEALESGNISKTVLTKAVTNCQTILAEAEKLVTPAPPAKEE